MNVQKDDYDTPWKEILETYFEEFLRFFFPMAAGEVDWERGYTFLDKELQQIVRDAELGTRFADKLVRLWKNGGEEAWVLVHVEIQGQEEPGFPKRMYVYNYRIFDRYDRPAASLAVLADERSQWRPDSYGYELWGCRVGIKFPVAKLLDYTDRWEELEQSENPFATVVMAHLKTIETRKDEEHRKRWKLYLVRRLYERGFGRRDIINLFRFIDWLMRLSEEMEESFWEEMSRYEEEKHMPYVTSVEKIGIKKGIQQGINQGIQQGINQGIQQGINQGIQQGINQGIQQGISQGIQLGKREGLIDAIELGLTIKFGTKGLRLMPEIRAQEGIDRLATVKEAIKTATELSEIEELLRD